MRSTILFLIISMTLAISCRKDSTALENAKANTTSPQISIANFNNPIMGTWELGSFKTLCGSSSDTTIYPNAKGDFVNFSNNDTAYYTYNSTNATGWSSYNILNDSTLILNGDTLHIISYDGSYLTTYCKLTSSIGSSRQWMTYIKK